MTSSQEKIKTNPHLKIPGREAFTLKKLGKTLHSMLDGTFLTRGRFTTALPFIVVLMILGVFYISNIFKVEKTKRQIDDLEEELRELRYEYITSRSRLMDESKVSKIALKLKDTGVVESTEPPKKILVTEKSQNKP
ncbi:MAG: FtsL-like putative cell division protein [Bacteroidales bacterium]|nr:FtsL-like putative cell division protein [Bacteroidales bacterium]